MNRNEFFRRFPQASEDAYRRNAGADYVAPELPNPQPQPSPSREDRKEVDRREGTGAHRCSVRIVSHRRRLLDIDNLAGGSKFILDAIRYQGYIRDDCPDAIDLSFAQLKVRTRDEEKTVITIQRIQEPTPEECAVAYAAALAEVQRENAEAENQKSR